MTLLLTVPETVFSDMDFVQFDQIRRIIEVPNDLPVGGYIYTINVKPLPLEVNHNRHIIYSLADRNFAINQNTGRIIICLMQKIII